MCEDLTGDEARDLIRRTLKCRGKAFKVYFKGYRAATAEFSAREWGDLICVLRMALASVWRIHKADGWSQ